MKVSPDWGWQRVLLAGMRDALSLPAWIVCLSLVGVGSLARDVGYPVGAAVLSTVLVWAGPSQVIFFASIAAGAAWSAIAFAIAFASLRFLPMTVALLPLVRRPGQGVLMQIVIAHFIAVTTWTEGLRRLPSLAPQQRASYFLGFGGACVLTSSLGTFAGYYLVGALPVPLAAGLLCLTPIFFLSSLSAGVRHTSDAAAIILGFCLAPIFERAIGGGFDLIISGVLGGSLAFAWRQLSRRRKA